MDYDQSTIPSVYDEARGLAPGLLQLWLDLVARDANPAPGSLIVDLGCGTGRFSEPLAERFTARVIGIDPSEKMLEVARRKTANARVEFIQSTAQSLPLADATVDLVFMSMVLHHLGPAGAAARECRRILRSGGHLCIRNITREGDFPHRRFFPGVEQDLPTRREVEAVFVAAGFAGVAHEIVTQAVAPNWPAFIHKIALRGYSTLARLDDKDFEAGMVALKAHSPNGGPDGEVTEEVDWFVFRAV